MSIDLRHRHRSWSISHDPTSRKGSNYSHARTASAGTTFTTNTLTRRQSQQNSPSTTAKRLKYAFGSANRQTNSSSMTPSSSDSYQSHHHNSNKNKNKNNLFKCIDLILSYIYQVVLTPISYLDQDWRAARGLRPLNYMYNHTISIVLLFFMVFGVTLGGLAIVGQSKCLNFDQKYSQQKCIVHEGVTAEYSLEGYVDTHWVPMRVSTIDAVTNEILVSNVTGVAGGWIMIDRFPMPPINGQITHVPDGESIFSNNVEFTVEKANEFRQQFINKTFDCLVPLPTSHIVDMKFRNHGCSEINQGIKPIAGGGGASDDANENDNSNGLYPYKWAIEDLLKNMEYQNRTTSTGMSTSGCTSKNTDSLVYKTNAYSGNTFDSEKTNAYSGDTFACIGRIIFVNATLNNDVKLVVDGYNYFTTGAIAFLSLWPFVCLIGKIHGCGWTLKYGYETTENNDTNNNHNSNTSSNNNRNNRNSYSNTTTNANHQGDDVINPMSGNGVVDPKERSGSSRARDAAYYNNGNNSVDMASSGNLKKGRSNNINLSNYSSGKTGNLSSLSERSESDAGIDGRNSRESSSTHISQIELTEQLPSEDMIGSIES